MAKCKHWKRRVPREVINHVWKHAGGRCEWCGSGLRCGIDHIIPKGRGGPHKVWNFQLLCNRCGCWKGHNMPHEVLTKIRKMRVTSAWAESVKMNGGAMMASFVQNGNRREGIDMGGDQAVKVDAELSASTVAEQSAMAKKLEQSFIDGHITLGELRRSLGLPPEQGVVYEVGGATFPNPLDVRLGEGKILCAMFRDEIGGRAGLRFSFEDGRAHEIGECVDDHSVDGPKEGEVYISCTNIASARVLQSIADAVVNHFSELEYQAAYAKQLAADGELGDSKR